jgi:actin-related protein
VVVREERFQAPEILFQPHLADKECVGVAQVLFECIMAADMDCRAALFKHIVLSGGTTTLVGFKERLETELKQVYVEKVLGGDRSSTANVEPVLFIDNIYCRSIKSRCMTRRIGNMPCLPGEQF